MLKISIIVTAWKVFVFGVILVLISPLSNSSVFSPNAGKYGPKKFQMRKLFMQSVPGPVFRHYLYKSEKVLICNFKYFINLLQNLKDEKSEMTYVWDVWDVLCISNSYLNYLAILECHCNGFRGIVIRWWIATPHHFTTF